MLIFLIIASLLSFEVGYLGYQTYINYKYKREANKFDMIREQLVKEREQHTKKFEQLKKDGNK